MKSSSYIRGLTMSLEHIDNAKNSVHLSLPLAEGSAKRPKNKLKTATIFDFRLRAGPEQARLGPFTRCDVAGQLVGY